MDTRLALDLLRTELAAYRSLPYAALVDKIEHADPDCKDIVGPDGKSYQLEVQFFWDDKPRGNVRVMASIDDGGLRAFLPLTDSFILSPTGEFVGE